MAEYCRILPFLSLLKKSFYLSFRSRPVGREILMLHEAKSYKIPRHLRFLGMTKTAVFQRTVLL